MSGRTGVGGDSLDYCATSVRTQDVERYLACLYAPSGLRPALLALHALDLELAGIVRTTSQPMIGEMRLAWWREALQALDRGRATLQPVLQLAAVAVLPRGIRGAELSALENGAWQLLASVGQDGARARLGADELAEHARARGGALLSFMLRAALPDAGEDVRTAARAIGEGWALADLCRATPELVAPEQAAALAAAALPRGSAATLALPTFLRALARLVDRDLRALAAWRGGLPSLERRGTPVRQLALFRGALSRR